MPAVLSLFYEFEDERGSKEFNSSGDFFFEDVNATDVYNASSVNFTMADEQPSTPLTSKMTR